MKTFEEIISMIRNREYAHIEYNDVDLSPAINKVLRLGIDIRTEQGGLIRINRTPRLFRKGSDYEIRLFVPEYNEAVTVFHGKEYHKTIEDIYKSLDLLLSTDEEMDISRYF